MCLIFDKAHFRIVGTMFVFTLPARYELGNGLHDFGSLFPLLQCVRFSLSLLCLLLVKKNRKYTSLSALSTGPGFEGLLAASSSVAFATRARDSSVSKISYSNERLALTFFLPLLIICLMFSSNSLH